jgi:succinyl-diaminopimelate desuccinylase
VSGALTLNFGVLRYENGTFSCGADMRCPVCADGSGIEETFLAAITPYGFSYAGDPKLTPSHCVPEESRLVQTCLKVYEAHTGEPGRCVAIGGGTYVHDIAGGIAFGIEFPGRDYRIHGADEYADLNELLQTAAMYADVIRELCYE